jgi:hypothetical protein
MKKENKKDLAAVGFNSQRGLVNAAGEPVNCKWTFTTGDKPLPELTADRHAIREEQKRDRERRTVRVKSVLP